MAAGIIDRLEAIEVEKNHEYAGPIAFGLGDCRTQAFHEPQPVGQRGQRVVVGEVIESLGGSGTLGSLDRELGIGRA
jgi:hypothetical protein